MTVHAPVPTRSTDRRGGDRHHEQPITVRLPLGLRSAIDRARGCDRSGRCTCGAPTRNAYIVGLVETGVAVSFLQGLAGMLTGAVAGIPQTAEVGDLPQTAEVAPRHSLPVR